MNISISRILSVFKSDQKIKDSVILGTVGGLIATIAMDLSNLLLWRAKKTEGLYGHLAGSMIMRSFRTNQRKNFILGQLLHTFTGSILGIPYVYLLKKTGKDHHLFKGLLFGGLSWGVLYSLGQKMGLFYGKGHLTKTHYSALFNNSLFGIVLAQTVRSLAAPDLFPETQSNISRDPYSGPSENPDSATPYYATEAGAPPYVEAFYH